MTGDTGPAGFHDTVHCPGRALVILLSPDEVPRGRDENETNEDNTRVIHSRKGDRKERGHAEQGDNEDGPDCIGKQENSKRGNDDSLIETQLQKVPKAPR